MESLLYEVKPYILLGIGGGAEIMHIHSNIGLLSAYLLGMLGGLILGMRITARKRRAADSLLESA